MNDMTGIGLHETRRALESAMDNLSLLKQSNFLGRTVDWLVSKKKYFVIFFFLISSFWHRPTKRKIWPCTNVTKIMDNLFFIHQTIMPILTLLITRKKYNVKSSFDYKNKVVSIIE